MGYDGSSDDLVGVSFSLQKAETDLAILFEVDGEDVWIPKSQIEDVDGDMVIIPRWLADKKELDYDY